jgi:hypothetical protein
MRRNGHIDVDTNTLTLAAKYVAKGFPPIVKSKAPRVSRPCGHLGTPSAYSGYSSTRPGQSRARDKPGANPVIDKLGARARLGHTRAGTAPGPGQARACRGPGLGGATH